MAKLRLGRSYWLDDARNAALRLPTFHGAHETDIAIVGGGITGCAVAYFFATAGARVTLLEKARLGRGSTAASTALLMQEPDTDFTDLASRYGRAVARRVWIASRAAVLDIQRTLRSLHTPTLHRVPSLYLERDASGVATLRRELAARRRAGLPGTWLSERRLSALSGLDAHAAILTPGNAQVDPYAASLTLARAAQKHGARFFERSRVTRIDGRGGRAVVHLAHGRLIANQVVIATGYATPEFKPLVGRFKMMNTYVVATPRVSGSERRRIGLRDVMLWDTERPYHYARWTPDGRLLFGGGDRSQAPVKTRRQQLERRIQTLWDTLTTWYPSLEGSQPAYGWEGLFARTPDGLPFIGPHRRYPRHLFALGYGGNGMTFGFLAGRLLVRLAQGERGGDIDLFGFNR